MAHLNQVDTSETEHLRRVKYQGFRDQLEKLISLNSMESMSNTPDFILAQYMQRSLTAFDAAVTARDMWFGFKPFENTNDHK